VYRGEERGDVVGLCCDAARFVTSSKVRRVPTGRAIVRRCQCSRRRYVQRTSAPGDRSEALERDQRLEALRRESERDLREQIRRLLALPMNRRTHFLRVRLPGGGSAL
jgi:hypothetical protein